MGGGQQLAGMEPGLDLAPFLGQEARTVGADAVPVGAGLLGGPQGDQFGHAAGLAVDDGPEFPGQGRAQELDGGLGLPVLLRVENLLDAQITLLHESFAAAITTLGYGGEFRGVYPVKVNQQQQVLEEIAKVGGRFNHGFEVGSKAELIAALSFLNNPRACLVCNGYKDKDYIDLALYACKMGFLCFLVLEMPSELPLILERSRVLGIEPRIGVRIKVSSQAGGHWAESAGDPRRDQHHGGF